LLFSLLISSKKHAFSLAVSLYVNAVVETSVERRGMAAKAVLRNRILRAVKRIVAAMCVALQVAESAKLIVVVRLVKEVVHMWLPSPHRWQLFGRRRWLGADP
jgi:RNase P protein component